MSDVRGGHRPRGTVGRWAGLVGRGRSAEEPDRGTVDDVAENDGVAEDVRDDEATRSRGTTPAGLPQRAPTSPRGGDGARAEVSNGSRNDVAPAVEDLLTRLAAAERARAEAEAAREDAVRRAEALAAALDDARSRPAETFGMRADKVLRMAEHEAAQRRRFAEQEAEALREQALAEAERITAAAHAAAGRIAAEASAEVDRLRAEGATARRDSELVADTAASMHAHVSGLRSSVRDELARLHALLGTELSRLDGPARLPGERDRRADTGSVPATGDLPAVSLPEQRAAGADSGDGPRDDQADGRSSAQHHDAEPARTTTTGDARGG